MGGIREQLRPIKRLEWDFFQREVVLEVEVVKNWKSEKQDPIQNWHLADLQTRNQYRELSLKISI